MSAASTFPDRRCDTTGDATEENKHATRQFPVGGLLEHRRTPRYTLIVDVEITDMVSGGQMKGRTISLSVAGCGVESLKLLPQGTTVRLRFSYQGEVVRATAKVIYSTPGLGMGMAFTSIEYEAERIIKSWIATHLRVRVPE